MYRQPSRWERQITAIENAAEKGKFSITLHLYPSEYRKLEEMGFSLGFPTKPFTNTQPIEISWNSFGVCSADKDENDNIYKYCLLLSDELPKVALFSDVCMLKSIRGNLKKCTNPLAFAQAFRSIFE